MKLTVLATTALALSGGLMLSASAQAHLAGQKLDDAKCSAAWTMASPTGDAIYVDQAERYVTEPYALDMDGDNLISVEEFKTACADGLMKPSDEATTHEIEGGKAFDPLGQMKPEAGPDESGESGPPI